MVSDLILLGVFIAIVISSIVNKDKVKKSDLNWIILLGSLVLFKAISYLIFRVGYYEGTSNIIKYSAIAIILVGVFQLITNKINYKLLGGRVLGVVLILSTFGFLMVNNSNNTNKIIHMMYDYNAKEINDFKKNFDEVKRESVQLAKHEFENDKYYKTLDKEVIGNNTFYYDGENSKESIETVIEAMQELDPRIKEMLKASGDEKTEIAILTSFSPLKVRDGSVDGFVSKINNVLNVKSLYSFKGYYLDENLSEEVKDYFDSFKDKDILKNYKSIIVHEYTHKLTNDLIDKSSISRYDVPSWFYEGIGILALKMNLGQEEELVGELNSEIDLRDNSGFHGSKSDEYYRKSGIVIRNIVDEYGVNVINDILTNINDETDIYKSIEKVTGKVCDEFGI